MRGLLLKACQETMSVTSVAGAKNAEEGLALCRTMQPDIVLLDLALPDRDGLDLLPDLLAVSRSTKVICLTSYTDEVTLHRAFRSPLHGFVDKNEATFDHLAAAVQAVVAGERYFSPTVRRARLSLGSDPQAFDKILSAREQSLLRWFGRGLSNEAIAAEVNLSELTVRNHRYRTMAKLGLRTTAELVRYALEKGFARVESPGSPACH